MRFFLNGVDHILIEQFISISIDKTRGVPCVIIYSMKKNLRQFKDY